ncbi:MAG: cell division protein FtsQ/DivIB [Pseudomonadota bacterium]
MTAKKTTRQKPKTAARARPPRRVSGRVLLLTLGFLGGGGALAAAGVGIAALGGPAALAIQADAFFNRAAIDAGFGVAVVTVEGAQRSGTAAVLAAAKIDASRAIFAQDLAVMRARIEALPWVAEAMVSRTLPGTLRIVISEHVPFALWQHEGRIRLIDRAGEAIIDTTPEAFPELPLVVGAGAPPAADALARLLALAPGLAARVTAATRVGERRWDLKFDNGVVLSLPEEAPEDAWRRFAALQARAGILEQGYARLDLRLPDMLVVRPPKGQALPRQHDAGQST